MILVLAPVRYDWLSLKGDLSNRRHHAAIFHDNGDGAAAKFEVRTRIPQILTWTPTGHGTSHRWDVIRISSNEVALLIPRSWWVWFVPFISKGKKVSVFCLEYDTNAHP